MSGVGGSVSAVCVRGRRRRCLYVERESECLCVEMRAAAVRRIGLRRHQGRSHHGGEVGSKAGREEERDLRSGSRRIGEHPRRRFQRGSAAVARQRHDSGASHRCATVCSCCMDECIRMRPLLLRADARMRCCSAQARARGSAVARWRSRCRWRWRWRSLSVSAQLLAGSSATIVLCRRGDDEESLRSDPFDSGATSREQWG